MMNIKINGISRIQDAFTQASARKAFIGYVVAGDPNRSKSIELIRGLVANGLDILELGIPFSDPMAEGRAIQEGHFRALSQGTDSLPKVLDFVEELRQFIDIPIILMGYVNSIGGLAYHQTIQNCAKAGVDGLLIVDLPLEELDAYQEQCQLAGVANIQLVGPNTSKSRLDQILVQSQGFIYLISYLGVTGDTKLLSTQENAQKRLITIKEQSNLPVVQGFGIKTPQDVQNISKMVDGVVVGTALVELCHDPSSLMELTKSLRDKMNR